MSTRPKLSKQLHPEEFHQYYYLLKELKDFCRQEGLQSTGGKLEIQERIAWYLTTGKKLRTHTRTTTNRAAQDITLSQDTLIEEHFRCSQKHREFFQNEIGKSFKFNVAFQNWLKENAGKTYKDAMQAYYQIQDHQKIHKTTIHKQFEYNTYIRDFFDANTNLSLKDAIACWKYKRSLPGHNVYEAEDLLILQGGSE